MTNTGRNESEAERLDRNLVELLQELRVASIGVQVLFGLLLSLPFTQRFDNLDYWQHQLYVADVLVTALAVALLSGPVAFHRLVYRRHRKDDLMKAGNIMAIAGLVAVAVAVSSSVLLVLSVVDEGFVVPLLAALTFGTFVGLWFVVPFLVRSPDDY